MKKYLLLLLLFLIISNLSFVFAENFQTGTLQFTNSGGNLKICSSCNWDFTGFSNSYEYLNYQNTIIRNWLTTTSCNPSISSGKITANFAISGDKATVKSYLETYNRYDVLTNNLYMKVNVIYGIRNSEGIVITESDTISSYASPEGYAIPTNHKFTQTYVENLAKNLGVYGNYQVFVDRGVLGSGLTFGHSPSETIKGDIPVLVT